MRNLTLRWIVLVLTLLAASQVYAQTTEEGPTGPPGEPGRAARPPSASGPAVDAQGRQAVDPTENVKDLVEAEKQRNNDLREAEKRHADALAELLAELLAAQTLRLDQMREAEAKLAEAQHAASVRRADDLRAAAEQLSQVQFEGLLQQAELDRAAFAEANRAAQETAKGLALSQQESANVLSGQVATAAATATANLERLEERTVASTNAITDRLGEIERKLSELSGRSGVTDPAFDQLATSVQALITAQASGAGRDTGASNTIIFIAMGISALLAILGIIAAVAAFSRRPQPVWNRQDGP